MPIYEYLCTKCHLKFTELKRGWSESAPPACPRCGNKKPERQISTFAYHRSIKTIHEESGEPSMTSGPDFYKDPRNIGRWAEKNFEEMGMEVPPEVREEIDSARDGVLPDSLAED